MKRIFSVLICLALLMSGVCFAEETAAQTVSNSATISDIVVRLYGEDYPINPEIVVGAQTRGESVLVDFGVNSEGEKLLPIQMKLDESAAAVIFGGSRTAYTVPMDLIRRELEYSGVSEAALAAWIESYIALIEETQKIQQSAAVFDQAAADALLEKIGVKMKEKDVTATIGGAEQPAVQRTYRVSHEQMMALVDEVMAMTAGSFNQAYADYMEATFAFSGMDAGMMEEFSFAAIMEEIPVKLSMHVDETINAQGAGFGMIKVFITVTEQVGDEGRISKSVIPVSFTMEDADTMTMDSDFAMEIDGSALAVSMHVKMDGLNYETVVGMNIDDMAAFDAVVSNQSSEDGAAVMNVTYDFDVEGVEIGLEIAAETDAEGLSDTAFALDVMEEHGFSCRVRTDNTPIEDRIAGAQALAFAQLTDTDPAFMRMSLAFMGLAGDVEILWNEESVSALVDAVLDLTGYYEVYEEDFYEGGEYFYDDGEFNDDGYGDEFAADFEYAVTPGGRRHWT